MRGKTDTDAHPMVQAMAENPGYLQIVLTNASLASFDLTL